MRRFYLVLPIALGAGLVLAPSPADSPGPPGPPVAAAPDSLDDGPHVFWQDDTHAVAFYLCGGESKAERLEPRDTLAFTGLCTDSASTYRIPARTYRPDRDVWANVPRILAISDIHGEYDAMLTFLRNAGVVDSLGHWTWGDGHLVVVGDMVDRGNRVTELLWFLYRLEQDAARAGGYVHVMLGNHEMMVMRDDLRYTNEKYIQGIVRYYGVRYPDLFGPEMELGRWLRSKPIVVKLNDILFVHGGIAPELVTRGLDISTINASFRQNLDISSVSLAFSDLPRLLLGSAGPLWYRGYFAAANGRYPAATTAQIDTVLQFYGVKTEVIGHTEIGQISPIHGGRIVGIDVDLETLGAYQGLLWEDGEFSVVSGLGTLMPLMREGEGR